MRALQSLVLALIALAVDRVPAGAELPQIDIGVIAPLTGGLAPRGKDMTDTLSLLEEQLNSESRQYRYRFVIEDGKCGLGSDATTIAQRFISLLKIKFLITGCSGETLQAGPIAEREKALLIAVLSNHKDVRTLGDYIFRTYPDIEDGMKRITAEIKKDGKHAVAILTEDNAFTQGMKRMLVSELGPELIFAEDFTQDVGDYKTVLLRMRAKKPDAVYINVAADRTMQNLFRQMRQIGVTVPAYGYYFPGVPETRKILGDVLEGVKYLEHPESPNPSAEFQQFLRRLHQRVPAGPSTEFLLRTTYDAAMALVSAIEATGADPVKSKDYLYSYDKWGALGRVKFDANGDLADLRYAIAQIKDGQVMTLK